MMKVWILMQVSRGLVYQRELTLTSPQKELILTSPQKELLLLRELQHSLFAVLKGRGGMVTEELLVVYATYSVKELCTYVMDLTP